MEMSLEDAKYNESKDPILQSFNSKALGSQTL